MALLVDAAAQRAVHGLAGGQCVQLGGIWEDTFMSARMESPDRIRRYVTLCDL